MIIATCFVSLSSINFSSDISNTHALGNVLYTDYIYLFQLSGMILLVAMIGAIVLARRDVMSQDISTGLPVDQELIEKSSEPLLTNKN